MESRVARRFRSPLSKRSGRSAQGSGGGPSATAQALIARIGNTPLLPLPSPRPSVEIYGKAEWFNPGGSVKDRPAWEMVREALMEGHLPGRRLLDASSGNTGIAYSMLGAAIGFGVTMCIPANASRERLYTLRAYGAHVVLTDPLEGSDGAIRKARQLAAAEPKRFWYADQYSNSANWRAHYLTTAEEIWRVQPGLTHFVAGLGTTGTLVGTGRRLRELVPEMRVVSVQPAEALHGIEGLKDLETALTPAIFDDTVADENRRIETELAQRRAAELAREAGLFVGASSGAAYAACWQIAERLNRGTIVTVLCDGGSRYLSEDWWFKS